MGRCRATGKVPHASFQAAMAAKKACDRKRGVLLHAYRCSSCKKWHLGNTRGTRLENMNRLFDKMYANTGGERAEP